MSDRSFKVPFLLAILIFQMAVLTSTHHYYGRYLGKPQVVLSHEVMLEHFKPCAVYEWKQTWASAEYVCADNDERHGYVYQAYATKKWVAFGWGIPEDPGFRTQEAAKQYIERKTAYWMRPALEIPEAKK